MLDLNFESSRIILRIIFKYLQYHSIGISGVYTEARRIDQPSSYRVRATVIERKTSDLDSRGKST